MPPPSFPARPVNGGTLSVALAKTGHWAWQPKYNGWRAWVHTPTGSMFNRKNEPLSIAREFQPALAILKRLSHLPYFEWLDCEALERRHNIGRGTLIILDAPLLARDLEQRCFTLEFDCLTNRIPVHQDLNKRLPDNSVWLVPSYPGKNRREFEDENSHLKLWDILQQCNQALGCTSPQNHFFEGLVAKRVDSLYPMQLRSPDVEFPFWMKHRFPF